MKTTRTLWRWFTLALLMTLLPTAGIVSSQEGNNNDNPAPEVIDVWPLPGVEMAGQDPLTLTFNQPMDTLSVEEAFSIGPELSGSFTWGDARTFNFIPDNEWPVGQTYTVTIDKSAHSGVDAALEMEFPFSIDVQTVGPLDVSAVAPDDGAEGVAADSTIVVTFNRPVQALVSTEDLFDLPTPITIEPAIEGSGEWVNTSIYVFTPKALEGGTTYTVTVGAGLTSIDGASLSGDYVWSFSTLPPQILDITPYSGASQILLNQKVTIRFSQAMDTASVEEAFSLVEAGSREPVVGKFEWDEAAMFATFVPDELLKIGSTYRVTIQNTATSANGDARLSETVSRDFTTVPLPGVQSTYPSNGERNVRPGGGFSISFKSAMKTETLDGKVIIDPEPAELEFYADENQTWSLSAYFASKPNTHYTVTLKAGAEDIYGNAIPNDYTFSFDTGPIPTYFRAITQGSFMLTGAHRNTRLAGAYSGTPNVSIDLYNIDLAKVNPSDLVYGYYSELPAWASSGNLRRHWEEEFDSGDNVFAAGDIYLDEAKGTLPNGIYWVRLASDYDYGNGRDRRHDAFTLVVATANLTVKRAEGEMMIWMTDMPTGKPVPNANISVYQGRELVLRGQTDTDGVFKTPTTIANDDFLFITAETETDYAVWYTNYAPSNSTESNIAYTDRPIYRPGETVYFRGVMRNRDDMTYTIPNLRSVDVEIKAPGSDESLYKDSVEVTQFGTFSGELKLADNVRLGSATIYVNNRYFGSFEIAEFRVPEYEVSVTPQEAEIVAGDTLNVMAQANYYFGGPVSNANLSWYLQGSAGYFSYKGQGNYTFVDWDASYPSIYESGSGTTDSNGGYVIQTENTNAHTTRPMNITIETTVSDESNQPISGRTSVMVHPSNVYIGQRTDQYFGRANQAMTVDLIAVTPQSVPLVEQKIDLTLVEIRWDRQPVEGQFGQYTWSREEIEVLKDSVVTGEDGKAQFTFTPPNGGIFRLRATSMDERERINTSALQFWVIGDRPVWWGEPSTQLELVADADSYEAGDTAEILVPIPFAGGSTVLVTTERQRIMSHEVLEVEGSTLVYQLPITEDYAPTIHFTVTLIKGIDEESLNPEYRTGQIALNVVPKAQQLTVTVTPSQERAQPRETVSFDVLTTDSRGEPVSAEVGLRLTDKAILALMSDNSLSFEQQYYGYQGDSVYTTVALDVLLDRLTDANVEENIEKGEADDGAFADADEVALGTASPAPTMEAEASRNGAGGRQEGQQPTPVVRENFQQTPLWMPHVVTGQDGRATVELELPDNLTTWDMEAQAITSDTHVGEAGSELIVTLPLLVRPATPRFFVVDDRVELAMVINNNTESDQQLDATLEFEGVSLEDDATQTVSVPAFGRTRVRWMATVNDVEAVDLTFIAIGDGFSDASKPTLASREDGKIPVYRYTAPDKTGTAGLIRNEGSRVEGIALPSRIGVDSGTVKIQIDPSLAVTAIDSFTYLRNYKHQCIEQTVSRFLPNAVTFKALKDLGIEDAELEANLFKSLTEGLDILKRGQNSDGGWGWFNGMESNPLVTAYASLGLIEAREAGFTIEPDMLTRGLNYVQQDFVNPNIDSTQWQLNRQAFYLYVMARNDKGDLRDYQDLYEYRLKMSLMGRAYFLMAYMELFPEESAVQDLTSDLTSSAILSATGTHWEEDYNDWWNWSSDTRTTAVVLSALLKVQGDSDLLANAVRWLMIARDGDHWTTTQETVWSVIGLTDWMVSTGELQGDYDYTVSLNRELRGEGDVNPDNVRESTIIEIPVEELSQTDLNRLVVARGDGEGVLYYTTHLDLRLPAAEVDPISRGISVNREYFLDDDPKTAVTAAHIGDTITVRITITLTQDVYYFVLEDPIPAGTEGVNTSLLTTSRGNPGPRLEPETYPDFYPYDYYRSYNPYWYWGWWWFDHTEMRDEQTNLYADFLPQGTYVYTYQIQATTPGEFQTMPSVGYAFYMPEVFGRNAGSLFTITDAVVEETNE